MIENEEFVKENAMLLERYKFTQVQRDLISAGEIMEQLKNSNDEEWLRKNSVSLEANLRSIADELKEAREKSL